MLYYVYFITLFKNPWEQYRYFHITFLKRYTPVEGLIGLPGGLHVTN